MRVVSLLVLIFCGLSVSVVRDLPVERIATPDDPADGYEALQRRAELALDALRQLQERRLAAQLMRH